MVVGISVIIGTEVVDNVFIEVGNAKENPFRISTKEDEQGILGTTLIGNLNVGGVIRFGHTCVVDIMDY